MPSLMGRSPQKDASAGCETSSRRGARMTHNARGATRRTSMDFAAFSESMAQAAPPPGLSRALEGLWWDAKGDWDKAHECAQAVEDDAGNWVHAYLHRKEGDASNAGYWY